jgi:ADP-ribose pyrophosphatase YjhB (NUDIX family)
MEKVQLINDDYFGYVKRLRHACRGIVVKDGKVLLSYENKYNKFMIPGGGVEEGETYAECCERELLEETGMKVRAVNEYLEIEELFDDWRHINHYFICEFIEDTGIFNFTEAEKEAGYERVWVPFEDALADFGNYERFHKTAIEDYGLYRREYTALASAKKHVT